MMMAPIALLLALAVPPPVEAAARAALAVPEAQLTLSAYRPAPAGCAPREVEVASRIVASGTVVARFRGEDVRGHECSGAAFLRASVRSSQWVAARAFRSGELVEAIRALRELRAGSEPLFLMPAGARAARALAAGEALEEGSLRTSDPDAPVAIEIRSGALRIQTAGRRVPCARGRACAVLASGKRVEGVAQGDRLIVELP
jgi:hypothetical protein